MHALDGTVAAAGGVGEVAENRLSLWSLTRPLKKAGRMRVFGIKGEELEV